jgi:DNA primase large subunit
MTKANNRPTGKNSANLVTLSVTDVSQFPFSTIFYKVHFTEALELVRSRRVYLENGIAYVPDTEMKTLLVSVFKNLLAHNLALTTKTLPNLVLVKRTLGRCEWGLLTSTSEKLKQLLFICLLPSCL